MRGGTVADVRAPSQHRDPDGDDGADQHQRDKALPVDDYSSGVAAAFLAVIFGAMLVAILAVDRGPAFWRGFRAFFGYH